MSQSHERGIIPLVKGGLGNQIFIVAAAYVTSKVHSCPLYILENPQSNNKHNKRNYNYNNLFFKYFGTHIPISQQDHSALQAIQYRFHTDGVHGFQPWSPYYFHPGMLLGGYYQFYPPLASYEEELQTLLLKGIADVQTKVGGEQPHAAFLHVRRGDAHENLHIYYLLSIEYYQRCVEKLRAKNPAITKIYIVSDEFEWVHQQPYFSDPLFECYENADEVETFALMSNCTGGAICGGSTFSWWAAFLGAHRKRNPVLVPKDWIKMDVVSLFPDEWEVVA